MHRKHRTINKSHSKPRLSYLSHYSIPLACLFALLLLGTFCINPINNNISEAYAAPTTSEILSDIGASSISLSITSGEADQQTSASIDEIAYRTNGIMVSASNVDGYKIFVQAADGSTSNLIGDSTRTEINGVGTTISPVDFTDNSWGYSLKDEELKNQVSNGDTLKYTTLPNSNDTTQPAYTSTAISDIRYFTLAFAAKFGKNAPADHYKTNVLVSAVAQTRDITINYDNFAGYTTFEQVTKEVCDTIPIGTEGRLKDSRDNKWYWVGRIKNTRNSDALCWMTQNLDYDGGGTKTDNMQGSVAARYYDPGEYVYTEPASRDNSCGTVSNAGGIAVCPGWVLARGLITSTDPTVEGATMHVDGLGYAYSSHYLIGNYYNWYAATNGSGIGLAANEEAPDSVCPAGWRLPLGGSSFITGGAHSLLYGVSAMQTIFTPFYFVHGGNINGDSLYQVGSEGTYWTATASDPVYDVLSAYYINIRTNGSASYHYATGATYRYVGYSVRCVAR